MQSLPLSVCLVSSRCKNRFTDNTRSKFANVLAEPLEVPEDDSATIYVRASSLAISTRIEDRLAPQVIKVHLRELVHQVQDDCSSRCIATLTYPPPEVSPGYALHVFENSIFLPLYNSRNTQIGVRLTDEDDQELNLDSGGDTILNLEVTEDEMKTRGAFSVSCSSDHPDRFPGNSLSKYTTPLMSDLHLGKRYEVALQSIIFPPGMYERCVATMRINSETFRYRLSEFENTQAFLANVQMDVVESQLGAELHFGVEDGRAVLSRGVLALADAPEEAEVEFSREFYLACGDTGDRRERVMLARGDRFVFNGHPDISLATPNPVALLESNVVENSIVADGRLNVLHCVPVKEDDQNNRQNKKKLYIPEKLFFRPVTREPIENVRFRFTGPNGEDREFRTRGNEEGQMIITLAFRRRR